VIISRVKNPELEEKSEELYFWYWVQNYAVGRRLVTTSSGLVGTTIGEV
jgi:hypothetical protein